jgi:hypothetical protein
VSCCGKKNSARFLQPLGRQRGSFKNSVKYLHPFLLFEQHLANKIRLEKAAGAPFRSATLAGTSGAGK